MQFNTKLSIFFLLSTAIVLSGQLQTMQGPETIKFTLVNKTDKNIQVTFNGFDARGQKKSYLDRRDLSAATLPFNKVSMMLEHPGASLMSTDTKYQYFPLIIYDNYGSKLNKDQIKLNVEKMFKYPTYYIYYEGKHLMVSSKEPAPKKSTKK